MFPYTLEIFKGEKMKEKKPLLFIAFINVRDIILHEPLNETAEPYL